MVALGVVLSVQAVFVFSYVGALHAPKPHKVSIGVVGSSPLPAAVNRQFSLRITHYPSEAAAQQAIDHRRIDGAFVAGPAGAKLIVVPAAGALAATALGNVFELAAAALHRKVAVVQAHPLRTGDAVGNVSFLVVMALIIGGYLASTIGMAFGGPVTRRRRRLASLAIVSVIGALVTDVIAGPILGAIPTSKFIVLWGLFAFVMIAVAYATAALQAVLGAAGTLVVVVVFVILGAPASGGTVPSAFLPGFWRTFGPYLPAGAGTTIVRNTIYFTGNGITRSLLVIAAYLAAGAVVVTTLKRRRQATDGAVGEAEAAAAAAAAVV
jgi:hypothetical protein